METKDYVGKFVKVGKNYGMIDNVYGTRLGFIWSDKDSWTGELVDVDKVEVLTSTEDIAKARLSAKNHLLRERASLKARIAQKLKMDSQQCLGELLDLMWQWAVWVSSIRSTSTSMAPPVARFPFKRACLPLATVYLNCSSLN